MSILSLSDYKTFAGSPVASTTDSTRDAALTAIIADVDAAIKRAIKPFYPEPLTVTDWVMDAPRGNMLFLPVVPVRSITSLYLHWFWGDSTGDPTAFTSDDLLTQYDDYYLPIDTLPENYSRSGIVHRRGVSSWGAEGIRPVGRLADNITAARGAVKVTYAAGPTSVPDDLVLAASLATSLVYQRRVLGMPVTSESLNGYSYSTPAPFLTSVLASPDISSILLRYQDMFVGVA